MNFSLPCSVMISSIFPRRFASNARDQLNNLRFSLSRKNSPLAGGGIDVQVRDTRDVMAAYGRVRRMVRDSKLLMLQRRTEYYVKPRLKRQTRQADALESRRNADFREKIRIAMEMMESERLAGK